MILAGSSLFESWDQTAPAAAQNAQGALAWREALGYSRRKTCDQTCRALTAQLRSRARAVDASGVRAVIVGLLVRLPQTGGRHYWRLMPGLTQGRRYGIPTSVSLPLVC